MLPELPDEAYEEIQRLCAEGHDFEEQGDLERALQCFEAAWNRLDKPKENWSAGLWILGAIGDIQFQRGAFAAGREALMTAMKFFNDAPENPFLRLRLGQCMYELGEMQEAANWLAGAFLTEGSEIFANDDPKYLEFVRSKLEPPIDGWNEQLESEG